MPNNQRSRGPRDGTVARLLCLHSQNPLFRPDRWVRCALLALAVGLSWQNTAFAQPGEFGGSQQARAEALRAIPLDEMNEASREKLGQILDKPSVYRRMPNQVIECDPDLYVFLIRYPEVIVNIWQLMDVTKVQIKRTGAFTFDASDGAGTFSKVELIYGRPDLHVYYASGYYEGPLFRNRIEGDCVVLLRSAYTPRDGRVFITNSMDIFVRMENVGADILLKTLHPLMGKTADYNFVETAKFIGQVSQASENNGPGMGRLAGRLESIEPTVRDSFARYTQLVYQRAVLRDNIQPTPATLDGQVRADTAGGSPSGPAARGADAGESTTRR